ncbi:transmembrane domain near N [Cryptosporidium sp. chipmunk genotype I]|uniref:transmembrane domain near N n=1 Tax=Cryptosporidium sp. chipmunk genotype I TaxID=1280935 RepID=UPI00351A2C0F|nr:transmembrane domain near N [Cryptosporidium sp. chipmunk genotype I]
MRHRKEHKVGELKASGNEKGKDCSKVETEEKRSERELLKIILNFTDLLLHYFINIVKLIFHYIFDPRLNTIKELYPHHTTGKYEPRSKFGYRFFLVSNRVQNIGFGFEYRGVYYFSNAHFNANTDKLKIEGRKIRLYQQGFTMLCSRRVHKMKKPRDNEDLYLLNPYMPTIKGKCVYKSPFYYSFFPIDSICREFTGLPITNSKGELVSIYDNFRKMDNLLYNIIGDDNLWEEGQNDLCVDYKVENILTDHKNLQVFRVFSEFRDGYDNLYNDETVGYFFNYNSITYISGAFVNDSGNFSLSLALEDNRAVDDVDNYSNLYRDLWISAPDSKHNLSLPEQDEDAFVLNITGDSQKEIKGKVKMDLNQQFWAEFEGVPNRKFLGLPILNRNGQLIGIYSEFNIKNSFRSPKYSVYLGGLSKFKNYFLRMSLRNSNNIPILEATYDMEILEQAVSLCSLGIGINDECCSKLVNRVIFGVGSEDISQQVFDDIKLILKKYQNSSTYFENIVSVVNSSSIRYSQVQDKNFIIANTDWIGYSYLNSDNLFPFNSSKSLLIILSHSSTILIEELLENYYKSTHKTKRGFYLKLIPNK